MQNLNAASKLQFSVVFKLCMSHLLTIAAEGILFCLEETEQYSLTACLYYPEIFCYVAYLFLPDFSFILLQTFWEYLHLTLVMLLAVGRQL